MKNTIHTDNQQVLTYEKGVNGDISPSKKYEAEGSAYRLINCRINPLTHLLENVEGIDTNVTISVIRDGIIPVTASRTVLNSVLVGDMQVLALAGATPAEGQIAIYYNDQVKIVAQHTDMALYEGQVVDMSTDGKDEVYLCGSNQPNLFLSVPDMLASIGTEKYFTKFELDKHIPRVGVAMGVPMYVKHENIGSALGLKAGSYVYFLRLVDPDGNRTPWSQSTPLIPVAYQVGSRTVGAPVNASTSFGIRLRFRIDGTAGFSYVEIGRMAYNTGQPVGFLPNMEVTKVGSDAFGNNVVLSDLGQVIEFIDTGRTQYTASDVESEVLPSQMDNCNNVTYYDGRVIYSGIKYKQLDLSPNIRLKKTSESTIYGSTTPNTYMFPFAEDMGVEGHSNMYNQVYKKCETPGEYKNYGIVLWDGKGGRTPAIPLADLKAYRVPNLREPILPESSELSTGAELVPRVDGSTGKTLEIFQNSDGDELPEPTRDISWNTTFTPPYSPLHPISPTDSQKDEFRFSTTGDGSSYRMPVKNKKWRTIGNYIQGVDTNLFPEWVEAFSVVASDELGAVSFNGLVTYSWLDVDTRSKSINTVAMYSSDMSILSDVMNQIVNNPSSYRLQLQSPCSFIPDLMYSVNRSNTFYFEADILLRTISNNTYNNSQSTELSFGKWLNNTSTIQPSGADSSKYTYGIISAKLVASTIKGSQSGDKPGTPYLLLTLDSPIYNTAVNGLGTMNTEYFEPWYIATIKREGDFSLVSSNINTYKSIGHYQKLKSTLGVGTGASQELLLVDERPEDAIGVFSSFGTMSVGGKLWLHLNLIDPAIVTEIATNGFYVYQGKNIYGLYTHRTDGSNIYVKFTNDWFGTSVPDAVSIPKSGDIIELLYDNNKPIKLFSGDNYVGYGEYCPIMSDAFPIATDSFGTINGTSTNALSMTRPLYYTFEQSTKLKFRPWTGYAYQNNPSRIRALLIQFPSISKVNTPMLYKGYPSTNYIEIPPFYYSGYLRPTLEDDAAVTQQYYGIPYYTDFGTKMYKNRGGFVMPEYSLDYMRTLSGVFTSLPARGFTEVTYFPNRLAWSNRKQESVQDIATNKTFSALSVFDLPSASGDNTYITAANNVLTVFTENDIAKIPINRYTLSNVDGSNMGVLQTNRFIGEVGWLNANLGIPKDRRAMVADFMGSVLFITKDNEAYLLTDKLSPVSTGFRWKLDTILPNEVLGIARGFYRKDLGEVWIPNATGFMVYSLAYQSWYSVVLDASYTFVNHKAPICFKNGVFKPQNGTTDFGAIPLACRAYFIAQPLPSTFKSFVYLNMYGSNVNEIELWANKYHNVVGSTKAYSDVLKVRGNNQWAYFPSDEKPPYNRCQADWVIMAVKGSPLPTSDGKFSVTTIEVGSNKIV